MSTASASGEGDCRSLPNKRLGIALGGGDLGQLLLHQVGKAGLGGLQLAQRYVVLVVEFADAIAGADPSRIFGKCALGLVLLQLAEQRDHLAVEFAVGIGKVGIGADHQARRGVGGKAVEIVIGQDRDALLRHLEQASLDGGKGGRLDRLPAQNPAACIAVP